MATTGGDGEPPATDSKAGVWQGNLGFGDGVYIIDNNNNIYCLASTDGAAYHSLFGNLGSGNTYNGSLDAHFHPASNAVKGISFAPQGEDLGTAPTYNLNIVNGQTIESLDTNNILL